MPAFQKLAKHLVAEIPLRKLQPLLSKQPGDLPAFDGVLCGGGCPNGGGDGFLCGSSCRPKANAPGVIDPKGHLGLTRKDLKDIRNNLPKLRQAVAHQIEAHLGQLR